MYNRNIVLKAEILSSGIRFSEAALENLPKDVLIKRRAYGNPDDPALCRRVPQELLLLPERIVVGVSVSGKSPLLVDYRDGGFFILRDGVVISPVEFTRTPAFYGEKTEQRQSVESVLTYVSGHYLGIFVNTSCFFAAPGYQCKYCSIRANAMRPADNMHTVTEEAAVAAVCRAVTLAPEDIDLVFISGGNFADRNKNFLYYSSLALAIKRTLRSLAPSVEVVLNVFPPDDLSLTERLRGSGINVLVSTEVFSPEGYAYHCPGKSRILPKARLYEVLDKYLDVCGPFHVYSIVIQGLEPPESLIRGIREYAARGVCTVVNVLHVDPGTELAAEGIAHPTVAQILQVADALQAVYREYGFDTRKIYGGRNSFDAECSRGLLLCEEKADDKQ